jgi:hypothetical protein
MNTSKIPDRPEKDCAGSVTDTAGSKRIENDNRVWPSGAENAAALTRVTCQATSFKTFFLKQTAFLIVSGNDSTPEWRSQDNECSVLCLQAGMNYSISGFPDKGVYKTSLSSLDATKLFPKSLYTARAVHSFLLPCCLTRRNMPPS